MKKNLFLAALAGVALVGCAKNEVAQVTDDSQKEISFAAPVVAPVTKADYVTNTSISTNPSGFTFSVWGWYCEGEGTFASATAKFYMGLATDSGVEVTYDNTINDGTNGSGAWKPATAYYWPKNGKLSFSAYSPTAAKSDGTFRADAATGINITNYTVKGLDEQYDLLFSDRAYDKTTSTGGSNDTYDGVDIEFNHALAAIEIKARLEADYGTDIIKVTKITLTNVNSHGTFKQNYVNGYYSTGTPAAWISQTNPVSYELFNGSENVIYNSGTPQAITGCKNAIILPQEITYSTPGLSTNTQLIVEYQIKHGSSYLNQKVSQDLHSLNGMKDSTPVTVTSWEIGKRYTYNLVFGLEEVYFAPDVNIWEDVVMDGITIK